MTCDHWKFYVHTRVKLGDCSTKIFQDLKQVYGDQCKSKATIFRYVQEMNIEKSEEENRGRKRTSNTPENVKKVKKLVEEDRYIT